MRAGGALPEAGDERGPLRTAHAFLDTLADMRPHLKRGLWCAVALLGGVGL